jgi:DNA-binding NarL/FixJ family response regulator
MDEARVLLIEDNTAFQSFVRTEMALSQRHVLLEPLITTSEACRDAAKSMMLGKLVCDVVVLDYNLSPGSQDAKDAREFCHATRNLKRRPRIIGFSGGDTPPDIKQYIDVDLHKENLTDLVSVIDDLPKPEET